MPIDIIPIKALSDNYIWALTDFEKGCCAIVDPGEAEPIFAFLEKHQLKLTAILITHHHWDHVNGIEEIVQKQDVPVFGPALEPVPCCKHFLSEGDTVHLSELDIEFEVIDTPGHTLGHICYFGINSLFCGDTLFTAGCGRVFEGTPPQLYQSLNKLRKLPDETQVFCGHEYTQKNLEFALKIEANNLKTKGRLERTIQEREKDKPTVPSSLKLEKETNPFLRCHLESLQDFAKKHEGLEQITDEKTFAVIRSLKDSF